MKNADGKSIGNSIVKRWFSLETDPEITIDEEFWIRKEIDDLCDKEAREAMENCVMEVDNQPGTDTFNNNCMVMSR